ncbi:hypothetical protein AAMO2058_000694800 [Amorphochlora amoebiformis]|uniref:Mediator of RNA polymerase II transcription subunit 21 n=1 Tax=Amorphochlora amoebiformis TaxID=1561963 RepID=A0A7S0CRB1_9EUKA|mmetsp:Transcript_11202/g.17715  ORF Transcript_11202/g.17715 Transcript_11202/m.17715 type:complete len:138 (+) Transcript_11202:68-481(+)
METETFDAITQIQAYIRQISKTFEITIHELHNFKFQDTKEQDTMPTSLNADQSKLIKARADLIFQKIKEADLLMGSLPSHFESEKEQLEVIRQLQKENEIAGEKLAQATQLAAEWQKKVSDRIKQVAREAAIDRNPV